MNWHAAIVASLVSALALAQTPPAPGAGESKPKDRAARRAEDMRDQIERGDRQVRSHVRVTVRLSNGNRLTGVVKDGRLVERVDGLRFVDANAKDKGAGIRVWYSEGTRSYVFVPFRDLASYQVLQRLSNEQLIEIERQMQMVERRVAEERAKAEPKQPAKPDVPSPDPGATPAEGGKPAADGVEGGKPAEAKPTEAEAARLRQEQADAELLKKWPPKEGWNEAKRNEISRRLVVIGAAPSKHELEFVEKFDDWRKACERAGIDPNAPSEVQVDNKELRRRLRRDPGAPQ